MSTPYRLREEPARDLAPVTAEPRPLGRLRSAHATGGTTRRVLAGMTTVAGVLAVLAVAWPAAPWLVGLSLLLAFLVAAWVVVANVIGLDVVAEVHEGGLVVRRSWRRPVVVPFDDVRALHFGSSSYVFVLADGRRVAVPARVADEARLRVAIETNVERPVLSAALESLVSGEPLTFGPITVELDGLRHGGDLLPWSELGRVVVRDDGFVFVQRATEQAFVVEATRKLPYARVLVALLARRTKIETDDSFWTRFVAPV